MDLERRRGITIKAQSVSLDYKARNGEIYHLNFIDTPEIARRLFLWSFAFLSRLWWRIIGCGCVARVEAQSVANCYTAIDLNLEVVPVLNKIDLPAADPDRVCQEIEDIIGIDATDAVHVSAKTGIGIQDLLEQLVERIPAPVGDPDAPLKALIIDSWFDNYLGVVVLVRVIDGEIRKKMKIRFMSTGRDYQVERVGVYTPKTKDLDVLRAGEVELMISGVKEITAAKVGDTITDAQHPAEQPLVGLRNPTPRVCRLIPNWVGSVRKSTWRFI